MNDAAMDALPAVVQKWLVRSNVAGRNVFQTVQLNQTGQMRTRPDGKWMTFTAEQWFRVQDPGFIWTTFVNAPVGLKLLGRDRYAGGEGHMIIKMLSWIPVVNSSGKEIDQGSMLRYLAEIVWFPSAALEPYIRWEEVDSLTATATMTWGETTSTGTFKFNQEGDFISFEALRYYNRKDSATPERWYIQAEPDGYAEFDDVRIPVKLSVTWKLKEGDFRWLELEVTGIVYNP
jgi:hypothetical protein